MKKIILLCLCVAILAACQESPSDKQTLAELSNEQTTEEDTDKDTSVLSDDTDETAEKKEQPSDQTENHKEENNNNDDEEKENEEEDNKEEEDVKETDTKKDNGPAATIKWGEFFDEGDQTTPSKKFKDLKGEHVEIKGWMGEVLNLSQGWFLLISAPGAECPFCSEDESYWNEIMIVFVDDPSTLRYTKEPLLVEGTLDVGIKVDESNYKTMFRLYDARFTPVK